MCLIGDKKVNDVKEENLLYCGYCGKVLTNKTEIEYSRWLCEFYRRV